MTDELAKQEKRPSISRLLKEIIKKHPTDEQFSVGQLVTIFGDQAFGLIMILFALPNALPVSAIPGISFIFGLPILFVAIHLTLGRRSLWLPAKLAQCSINGKKLIEIIYKTLPYLIYMERFLKPRWLFLSVAVMERFLGVVLLLLSVLLLLPIPFSNFILAFLIILFGLGLAEKDGLYLTAAYLGAVIYVPFLASVAHKLWGYFFT